MCLNVVVMAVFYVSNFNHQIEDNRLPKDELKLQFNDMRDIDYDYHLLCYEGH